MSIPQAKVSGVVQSINTLIRCPFCLEQNVSTQETKKGTSLAPHRGCKSKKRELLNAGDMVHITGPHFRKEEVFEIVNCIYIHNNRLKILRLREAGDTEDVVGMLKFRYDEIRHGWQYLFFDVATQKQGVQRECRDRRHSIELA